MANFLKNLFGQTKNTKQPTKIKIKLEETSVSDQTPNTFKEKHIESDWFSENNKYGLRISNGKTIVNAIYDAHKKFVDGVAPVKLGSNWGFINSEGKQVTAMKYDDAEDFKNGFARVVIYEESDNYRGRCCTYIDVSGKEIFSPLYDTQRNPEVIKEALDFYEGLACVKYDRTWGFLNTGGKLVIPMNYIEVSNFKEGMACFKGYADDGKLKKGFIDTNGNTAIKPIYEDVYLFSEGLAAVKINNRWGYINQQGEEVIPPKYNEAYTFDNGFATVVLADTKGKIDTHGKEYFENVNSNFEEFQNALNRLIERRYYAPSEWRNNDNLSHGLIIDIVKCIVIGKVLENQENMNEFKKIILRCPFIMHKKYSYIAADYYDRESYLSVAEALRNQDSACFEKIINELKVMEVETPLGTIPAEVMNETHSFLDYYRKGNLLELKLNQDFLLDGIVYPKGCYFKFEETGALIRNYGAILSFYANEFWKWKEVYPKDDFETFPHYKTVRSIGEEIYNKAEKNYKNSGIKEMRNEYANARNLNFNKIHIISKMWNKIGKPDGNSQEIWED